jgi:hypothetical protein
MPTVDDTGPRGGQVNSKTGGNPMASTTEHGSPHGDADLVRLLTSQVTASWGRTVRAAFLIVCWRWRGWPFVVVGAAATGVDLLALIAR